MKDKNSLAIQGKNVSFEIKDLNVDDINYYSQNPRINSVLESYGENVSQQDIEKEMWEKLQHITHELYRDIKDNGGLQDEIIVYNNEVLEGNSRLCAYRYLKKNEPENPLWNKIRAKVILTPLDKKQINALLCQQHIKGKKDWEPYEKASYMFRMKEQDGMNIDEIAKMTNFSPADVKKNIEAYEFMKSEGVTDLKKFSHYLELKKSQNINQIRKDENDIDIKVSKWIKEDRIPNAQLIRKLPDILKDKKSRKAFENKGEDFDTCLDYARQRNPALNNSFYSKIDGVTDTLRNTSPEKIREEIENDPRKKHKIVNLAKQVKRFSKNVGIEIKW